jgi:hypothetical protein
MEYLSLIPATALGYLTFKATTHPTSRIRRKMPNVKVKRLQIFPVVRFYIFGRVIHLHHWVAFSIILVLSAFISFGIFDYMFTKGLLLGGIIQGLTLPKGHKKIIYKDFSIEALTSVSDHK